MEQMKTSIIYNCFCNIFNYFLTILSLPLLILEISEGYYSIYTRQDYMGFFVGLLMPKEIGHLIFFSILLLFYNHDQIPQYVDPLKTKILLILIIVIMLLFGLKTSQPLFGNIGIFFKFIFFQLYVLKLIFGSFNYNNNIFLSVASKIIIISEFIYILSNENIRLKESKMGLDSTNM